MAKCGCNHSEVAENLSEDDYKIICSTIKCKCIYRSDLCDSCGHPADFHARHVGYCSLCQCEDFRKDWRR